MQGYWTEQTWLGMIEQAYKMSCFTQHTLVSFLTACFCHSPGAESQALWCAGLGQRPPFQGCTQWRARLTQPPPFGCWMQRRAARLRPVYHPQLPQPHSYLCPPPSLPPPHRCKAAPMRCCQPCLPLRPGSRLGNGWDGRGA
eukprot:scaffold120452_cov18-Tisochrysis_lutea.AAC.2